MNHVVSYVGGRLGNNLFNIATGFYYANKTGRDLKLFINGNHWKKYYDTYDRFHIFPIVTGPFDDYKIFKENDKHIVTEIPEYNGYNVVLRGTFESEDYFPDRRMIDELFQCPKEIEQNIKNKFPNIDNAIGISIRRGDYLAFRNLFLIPKTSWYIDCYEKYFNGSDVIVFSDDIDYCKKYIGNRSGFTFYDNKHGSDRYMINNPIENIYTMAMCHHHICSCSTWSWWGARLCERDDAINVFQDKRFTESCGKKCDRYIPDRWVREAANYE